MAAATTPTELHCFKIFHRTGITHRIIAESVDGLLAAGTVVASIGDRRVAAFQDVIAWIDLTAPSPALPLDGPDE